MKIITGLLLLVLHSQVWAWGHKGHAAVADIASVNLTPAAQAQVEVLLKNDLDRDLKLSGRTTLAAVSSWPDEIREIAAKDSYKGWHTRANPVCSDALAACKNGKCVDQNIIAYAGILKDSKQPLLTRNEALKWVVHLVGDLHMPMHSGVHGKDIEVTLDGIKTREGTTLHNAWDTELAVLALKRGKITATLTSATPLAADAPAQWMQETRLIARQYTFDPLPGFSCNSKLNGPVVLDKAYQQQSIPVIREQIAKAGLRLAQLLNEALP